MSSRVRGTDSPEHFSDITYLGLNQDQTCLAVGTGAGFMIFSTETCALLHHEECGAVSVVEMLFRTSLLALVGHSARGGPGSSGRQLTMWNTKERCRICHLCFEALIYGVRMSHRRVVVLLREEVHILDLKTMKRLHVIDRAPSPWIDPTVASLCSDAECGYLALPMGLAGSHHALGAESGSAQISTGGSRGEEKIGLVSLVDTHTLRPVGVLLAHRSPVQALALNITGHMLATASSKASVIRVFAVPSLETLCVFRRGASPCRIFGLNFSRDSQFLCAAASSGTVHVFRQSEQMLAAVPPSPKATPELRGSSSPTGTRSVVELGPKPGLDDFKLPEAAIDEEQIEEDLDDWNVVPERPERVLEYLQTDSSRAPCLKRDALQALSEASETAVGNVAKHARSIFQMLPQSCRELVDAERAYAVVRLREEESPQVTPNTSPLLGPTRSPSISSVLGALPGASMTGSGTGMTYGYVACANAKSSGLGAGRLEVLVATRRGCAYVYDWSTNSGGEGRLRGEHSIAPENLEELQRTPRSRRYSGSKPLLPGSASLSSEKAKKPVEAPGQVQTSNLQKAQLGA